MVKNIRLPLVILLTWSGQAMATDQLPVVETSSVVALGGCLPGGAGLDHAMPMTGLVAQRFGLPRLLSWSLEASVIIPSGFGANLIVDVVHRPSFRWHLLDPGIHFNVVSPVTARHIDRAWDVTFGTGFDWRFAEHLWFSAVYRMFLPEPPRTIRRYGNLIIETVNLMPQEGQLWLGISYSFL
jgi:hypothetical protein